MNENQPDAVTTMVARFIRIREERIAEARRQIAVWEQEAAILENALSDLKRIARSS